MKGVVGAALMALVLVLYLGVVVQLALRLLAVDNAISRVIGGALLILPLIGLWALVAELSFGVRSQRLGSIVARESGASAAGIPVRPSGRPVRSAAEADFPTHRAAVERDPESWRAWFRLGLAYDACGDRRRARQSIRRAISLHRRGD